MKTSTIYLRIFCLLLFFSFFFSGFSQTPSARYTVTFTGTWNSVDHGTLPGNAHWSDLVGATHNNSVTFWDVGQLATAGIKDVAELGNNTNFNAEVNTAISNSTADQWLQEAFNPNVALGTCIIMDFIVSDQYPLLTLVTMIAPSPDWFSGMNSFSLLDGGNNWKTSVTLDMFPFDAGTDAGINYTSADDPISPVNIFSRINMAPFNDQIVGSLSITLEALLGVESTSFEDSISISPNPASDVIFIRNVSSNNLQSITIYDVLGNLVQKVDTNLSESTIPIQRNELRSGLYLINIISKEGQTLTKKLIFN